MTVLLIVLLMITACVFAYEHSKRRLMQAVLDCAEVDDCLLYTSPSPRDASKSRMPSSA